MTYCYPYISCGTVSSTVGCTIYRGRKNTSKEVTSLPGFFIAKINCGLYSELRSDQVHSNQHSVLNILLKLLLIKFITRTYRRLLKSDKIPHTSSLVNIRRLHHTHFVFNGIDNNTLCF